MTDVIRYYVWRGYRDYYDSEAEAVAACDIDNGEHVGQEVRSGCDVLRQEIFPETGQAWAAHE